VPDIYRPAARCYPDYVEEQAKLVTLIRRMAPLLTIGLLTAVAYDAWVFYARWSSSRRAELARETKEAEDARKTLRMLGDGGLKILNFYAAPGAIRRGDHSTLCYGVSGATSVRLEPAVQELHPALSYCLSVSPGTDTEYKLIAQGAGGRSVTSTVAVRVTR
jgi:hypothetical protein